MRAVNALRGLPGVGIVLNSFVNMPPYNAAERSFDFAGIGSEETPAEQQRVAYFILQRLLQQEGVPVLPSFEDILATPSYPFFNLSVNCIQRPETDFVAITVEMFLAQHVAPGNTERHVQATTWQMSMTALVHRTEAWLAAEHCVGTIVSDFAQDYRAQNDIPKDTDSEWDDARGISTGS